MPTSVTPSTTMIGKLSAVCIAMMVLLSGCTTNYTVNGATYSSKADADRALDGSLQRLYDRVVPLTAPVAPAARIVLASQSILVVRAVRGGTPDGKAWAGSTVYKDHANLARMIQKRNIFEHISVVDGDGGHVDPQPGEAVIYFFIPDNSTSGWYFQSDSVPRTPVNFDRGNADQSGKVQYFLDSIESLARKK